MKPGIRLFGPGHAMHSLLTAGIFAVKSPLFTGTPAGAGPVQAGDNLRATLEGYGMLDFDIR